MRATDDSAQEALFEPQGPVEWPRVDLLPSGPRCLQCVGPAANPDKGLAGRRALMSAKPMIEADYVVVGAGAVGMAIADTLISDSDRTVAIVDRRHRPGGHWHDAYPFVRLHGPSANYGVNSLHLGSDRIEASGLNQGLFELATGDEIRAYLDQ